MFTGCALDKESLRRNASPIPYPTPNSTAAIKPFPKPGAIPVKRKTYNDYRLGIEDVIEITVINNTSLNTTQAVRPDGKISFFPTGDIHADGLTLEQLRLKIVERLKNDSSKPYLLGVGDVVSISVYDHPDLELTQAVRPDGKVSVYPGQAIQAEGQNVDDLRNVITEYMAELVKNPIVNVVVKEYNSNPLIITDPKVNITVAEYNSRKVAILGSVEKPGILRMKSDTSLIEGISFAGGLTEDADLRRAMLFRSEKLMPVNFEKLFKKGEITQNVQLQGQDVIFIPSSRDNKVYVIGEVERPGSVTWTGSLSLLESVALAGGYTRDAQTRNVLVIKGGLVDPTLHLVDAKAITKEGLLENNIPLETGDVVYIPETVMASAERYFEFASTVLQPILSLESGMVLGNTVKDILTGESAGNTGTTIQLN